MKKANVFTHLAAATVVTILTALIYASVQQVYRSSANDPQLQIASDISDQLKKGGIVDKWFSRDTVEISQSLSVFTALYNDKGEPVQSTGVLDGNMPALPKGVFDFARNKGDNVFTWQPERGVRMAMVLRSLKSSPYSFVAVGRSLYEIEKREQNLRWMIFIGWILCIGVIVIHWGVSFLNSRKYASK